MNIGENTSNVSLNYGKLDGIEQERQEMCSNNGELQHGSQKVNKVHKIDKSTNVNWLSDLFYCDIDIESEYSVTIQEINISSDALTEENYIALNDQIIGNEENGCFESKIIVLREQQIADNEEPYVVENGLNNTVIRVNEVEPISKQSINFDGEKNQNNSVNMAVDITNDTQEVNPENATIIEPSHVQQVIQHKNEKEYNCNFCQRQFKKREYLSRHEKAHFTTQIYTCSSCQKQFRNRTHLKRHMIVHTNEKPYTCKCCQKQFNRKDNLHSHVKKTHLKEKPDNVQNEKQQNSPIN